VKTNSRTGVIFQVWMGKESQLFAPC